MFKKSLCLLVLITATATAGIRVDEYKNIKDPKVLGWYLSGLGNGLSFANLEAEKHGNKLYCPPKDHAFKPSEFMEMLDSRIARIPPEEVKGLWIEPMLLSLLIKKYPCPEGR